MAPGTWRSGAAVPGTDLAIGLAGAVILWLGIMPEPLLQVISSVVTALPKPG